jgi:hypothetical protein
MLELFQDAELTIVEADHLSALEKTIENGLQTFVEVGTALLEIRDSRLYRQTFNTFEDYCRDRWGIERRRAYQLMDAAQVVGNLGEDVKNFSHRESHVAPLTGLPADLQREVWQRAVDTAPNGKITAAHVTSVVDQLTADEVAERWNTQPEPIPMAVHFSSETPEHYTPATIIDAVIDVLGSIDLDPCSNSQDAPNVPAEYHYTIDDDGLSLPWAGKVYMNPPYGRAIGDWVNKLTDSIGNGVTEAIALVPARVDTQWWNALTALPHLVCFVTGRLTFIGNDDAAPFPSAVVYLSQDGQNAPAFYDTFAQFGRIWQAIPREWVLA